MKKSGWTLVFTNTGKPVGLNETVIFQGEQWFIDDGQAPMNEGSIGRIYLIRAGAIRNMTKQLYPFAIGCQWVKDPE